MIDTPIFDQPNNINGESMRIVTRLFRRRMKEIKDRRKVKKLQFHTNRHGETFLFAEIGRGKGQSIITLGYVTPEGYIIPDSDLVRGA